MSATMMIKSASSKPTFVMPHFVKDRNLFPFKTTRLDNGWLVAIAVIDKELADIMLELNAVEQRNPRNGNIEKFANDMVMGWWKLTHQAIAFDVRGRLFDGQNRLMAVSKSGAVIESLVYFGAGGSDEMKVLDTGGNRNAQDAARIDGIVCSKRDISLIRQMRMGRLDNKETLTNTQILLLMEKYKDGMAWVNEHFNVHGPFGVTPIRAAIGRAYYHCDLYKLKRFVQIYLNEVGHDGSATEAVPALLAKSIVSEGSTKGHHARDILARCLRAIQAYMTGHPIKQFRSSPEFLSIYLLPLEVKPRS